MYSWTIRFLRAHSLAWHFRRALATGFALRLCSAWFVYGPQALDDYKHGVWPAYQMYKGLPLDLPEYRSPLLNWLLSLALHVAHALGVDSARGQVRAMYAWLALIGMLGVVGTYLFARGNRSKLWGRTALWFSAVFPLMPFVSTRAFGEAVASALVPLGFGLLPGAPFFGFLTIGLATLFRFHVGLIYFAVGIGCVYQRRWRALGMAVPAGLLTLAAAAGVDVAFGRPPLATLLAYVGENSGGGSAYGVSPWYNPWIFVLLLGLAPFSFVFVRKLPALANRHGAVLWPWLFFVAAHSLVPHKEERFLYPIVVLELWSLAYLWSSGARLGLARRIFAPMSMVSTVVGLVVTCFVNTQAGEIEPPARIEATHADVIYLDDESLFGQSRFQFYFLRPPSELAAVSAADFTMTRIDDELERAPMRQAVAMLTSRRESMDALRALAGVETTRARCGRLERAQSPVDRLLYAMNPRHNQRRRPTWYVVCERTSP